MHWHTLVEQHHTLVKVIAAILKGTLPATVEFDELIAAGNIGLCEAAVQYDETQGAKFLTYASLRVRGAMLDYLRRQDHVPRAVRTQAHRENRTRMLPGMLSYNVPTRATELGSEEQEWCDLLVAPDGCPIRAAQMHELPGGLRGLTDNERAVIEGKYGRRNTLARIGAELGIGESRTSQLHTRALEHLRRWYAARGAHDDVTRSGRRVAACD